MNTSRSKTWHCRLNPDSPRYKDWRRILGRESVPIMGPIRFFVAFGTTSILASPLDLAKLNEGQRARLVEFICRCFLVAPEDANRNLDRNGFPIRAEDITITVGGHVCNVSAWS